MDFLEFSLHGGLQKGITAAGYVTCTPVQEQVLKTALNGDDLYVQSQTGTGKTAAYLVAIIEELLTRTEVFGKKVLILVPTRELAVQVEDESKILLQETNLSSFSFYGGVGYEKQLSAIKKGTDVLIGTPGRVIDLLKNGHLSLSDVAFLVVDEADRMFDMGFYPELRTLLSYLPDAKNRQTMLFSATLNSYVKNLAWEYTIDAKEITIEAENITVSEIDQELFHVSSDKKLNLLLGILTRENPSTAIIFCNTKRSCEVLGKRLQINGIESDFLIGDMPQAKRLKVLENFKAEKVKVLVATDVAARGIDVTDLAMVVNYDLPNESENYVHRIGRTARAGKSGKAYTFCSEQDVYSLPAIERFIEMQIPSCVADESLFVEDKSDGIYIKLENYHDSSYDEYEKGFSSRSRRSFSRSERDRNRGENSFKNKRNSKRYDKFEHGETSYSNKSEFSKKSKRYDKKLPSRPRVSKKEELSALENLSFDERMKLYKEKYMTADLQKPAKSYNESKKSKVYKSPKNNEFRKNSYRKNVSEQKTVQKPAKKMQEKKSFLQRIKAFFAR